MSISSQSRKNRIRSALGACLAAAGITLALVAAVYVLRGIWPFGTDNVAYMDAAQFYAPDYYRLWDAMHGLVSADVSWFSGLAENGNYGWLSMLYPANWVFWLVARDHVLEGLGLYLAAELAIIAVAAAGAVSVRFPRLSVLWRVLLALAYTFCGFTLQYYSNFMWLDAVALFPLLLLGLDRLLREGRPGLYALIYALYVYLSVYYTYMVTLYVLLYTLGWCWLMLPGEQRGGRLVLLGGCTALAFGVCAPYVRGNVISILSGARFLDNAGQRLALWLTNGAGRPLPLLLALGLGACLALALVLLFRRKRPVRPRAGCHRSVRLGLCALAVLLLGALVWWLRAAGWVQSHNGSGLIAGMTTWDLTNTRHTFLMLLGLSLCFAVLLRAWRARRQAAPEDRDRLRRGGRFFLYMAGVFVLPMVFTNIDTAWHFGQYNFFPMRYGYMLSATVVGFAGAALEAGAADDPLPPARPSVRAGAGIVALAVLAVSVPTVVAAFREYGACFLTAMGPKGYLRYFAALAAAGLAGVTLHYVLLRGGGRRRAVWAVTALFLVQTAANACGLIAPSDDHTYTNEYDPAYVDVAEQLYDHFSGETVFPLSRTKNVDGSLSAGYPAIAGVNALSSVRSVNSAGRLAFFEGLGYTTNYFRIMDVGGTAFSDMLLGVDRVLSAGALDEDLYIPGETVAGMRTGQCRYPGVTGLMYDPAALADYSALTTLPDRLNALYRAFTGADGALAYDPGPVLEAGGGAGTCTLSFTLDAPAFIYMRADGMLMNIAANGRDIAVPSYLNPDNRVYPAAFNANLLSLGLFPAGQGEITFTSPMALTAEDVALTALDQRTLEGFADKARTDPDAVWQTYPNGIGVTLTADREGLALFLPLGGWWRCERNGQEIGYTWFPGEMAGIPLLEGENTLLLYRGGPPAGSGAAGGIPGAERGAWLLALLSLAAALGLALWAHFRPGLWQARPPRWLALTAQVLFAAAAAGAVLFIYAVPTVLLLAGGSIVRF